MKDAVSVKSESRVSGADAVDGSVAVMEAADVG